MTVVAFDGLSLPGELEAVCLSNDQARVMFSGFADALTEGVATTDDIAVLRHDFEGFRGELQRDMDAFTAEMRHDMESFKSEIRQAMIAFKADVGRNLQDLRKETHVLWPDTTMQMTIRFGGLMAAATGALLAASLLK